MKTTINVIVGLLIYFNSGSTLAVNCGDAITSDLRLTADLHCTTSGIFNVYADDVTIDLNGHTISGDSSVAGIGSVGYNNLTIKNGTIRGVWVGVNYTRADGLKVNDVTFEQVGHAIRLVQSNGSRIRNTKIFESRATALVVTQSDSDSQAKDHYIVDNEFYETYSAVELSGVNTQNNTVSNNLIWGVRDWGIVLNYASNNLISNNQILSANTSINSRGVRLNSSSHNTIQGNTILGGGHSYAGVTILTHGIENSLSGPELSDFNKIESNHIERFYIGIEFGLSISQSVPKRVGTIAYNVVSNNRILKNTTFGINFNDGAHDNYVKRNEIEGDLRDIYDSGINNQY